jgi:tetratricopeptide (TPR) repeat protein
MNDDRDAISLAGELLHAAYECHMHGHLDDAIFLYQQSISIYPTAEAYTFLGWTYSFLGRLDDAIDECKKAIEIDPDFGNPYNDIGAYLIDKKMYNEAIPWLEKATQAKRYKCHHYPYYNLGRVYMAKGMWLRALQEFHKSLEIAPDYCLASHAVETLQRQLN